RITRKQYSLNTITVSSKSTRDRPLKELPPMSNPLAFPHISRLVDLPPDLAREAFDQTARDLARGPAGTAWTIAVPAGRVDLRGNGILSGSPQGSWPYR